ncbi:MAG TPA: heavy metal sensor histidine kinase [Candidatus Eisenbacteria bacterium]|nr:heavy metal sensor histidine kinase [Candidatus Eisenbacteria bacterium]
MKKLSIGFRLTLWYLAIFALGELVFGAGMWFSLRENVLDIVDDNLESQVEDLKTFLNTQPKDASRAQLEQEVRGTYSSEHSGDFLQLYSEGGELIYRSAFLETHPSVLMPANQGGTTTYRIRYAEGQYFRFLYQKLNVNGQNYSVQMGTTADDAVATLHLFRDYLLLFAASLLLVSGFVGYWISRRALAPVDELVQTARSIRGTNLSGRLQKLNTGDELQRLSDTLNEMLDRIELAFQRITQFTADASHELRTPVSLIRTEAELALRRSRSEAEYKESLSHILFEAERTTDLIEQLLELARADNGREVLDIQLVDLSQTLRTIVDRWQQVSAIRNLEFVANIGERPTFVMGDETLLRRLTEILLDNAFKYTPPPGLVCLSLQQDADSAWITVQDSGVGVAREDQGRIFERFYRVDKARARVQGGAGLGLAIAQWIVAQHRGTIRVESHSEEGATFTVGLPLTSAPVQTAQQV